MKQSVLAAVARNEEQTAYQFQALRQQIGRNLPATQTSSTAAGSGSVLPSASAAAVLAVPAAPLKAPVRVKSKNRCISQELVLPDGCPRMSIVNTVDSCKSARDYWNLWKNDFKKREEKYGCAWRVDQPAVCESGGTRKAGQRYQWWSYRCAIWDTIEELIRQVKEVNTVFRAKLAELTGTKRNGLNCYRDRQYSFTTYMFQQNFAPRIFWLNRDQC